MSKETKQTVVQLIIQVLDIECKSRGMNVYWDMYLEMEKEQMIKFACDCSEMFRGRINVEYENQYGGNK